MSKVIRQSVVIKASPHDVYEALMDARKQAKISGASTKIDRKVGGKFTIMGGALSGFTLELIANKKIVQAWRDNDWPKGHYSLATFTLSPVRGATKLDFEQYGVPDKDYRDISQGWKQYYWKPMKKMLEA